MEEGLKIKIGADIVNVTQSISELEQEFKDLSNVLKTQTGEQFVQTNKKLEKLKATIDTVKNVGKSGFDQFGKQIEGVGKSIDKVKPSAGGTTMALTNLNRVVQDAPFGFIAIQNNIDPLVQSFQQIKAQTGSTSGALKEIGKSLLGAGGAVFAVSALSSIITSLIQKYGSLSNALVELTSNQDAAAKRQRELNKAIDEAVAGQFGEIKTLENYIGILTNPAFSQKERINAYKILKKEYPGVIQNMTQENALTAAGATLLKARTEQQIEYIKLKAKESALIKLGEEEAKKQLEQRRNLNQAFENSNTILGRLGNAFSSLDAFAGSFRGRAGQLTGVLNDYDKQTKKSAEATSFFATELQNVQDAIAKIDPKISGLDTGNQGAKSSGFLTDYKKNLSDSIAQLKELKKQFEDNNAELTDSYQRLVTDLLTQEAKLRKANLVPTKLTNKVRIETDIDRVIKTDKLKDVNAKLEADIKKSDEQISKERVIVGKLQYRPTLTTRFDEIDKKTKELFKRIKDDYIVAVELVGKEIKTLSQNKITVNPSIEVQATIDRIDYDKSKLSTFGQTLYDSLLVSIGKMKGLTPEVKDLVNSLSQTGQQVYEKFNEYLAPAIDSVFSAIESGQSVIQSLGQAFKRIIIQITATIAKAAILAAILSLIPGFGQAGAAAGAAGATGFSSIFKTLLGFKQEAAPSIRTNPINSPSLGGLSGGSIQIQVGGQFNVRGTDLVAVVQSGSQRIGRVG